MQSILNERTGLVEIEKGGSKNNNNSRCRICLSDSTKLTSIFSLQIDGKPTIGDMLTSFCNFQLTKNFFDQICEKCSKETVRAYNFKLKCEKSHELLLKLAKGIKSDMNHEFFPFETIDMDYGDLDSATDDMESEDTKIGLLHTELDIPYPETETAPTESVEMESVQTRNIAGHQNKDGETTLLPTILDVDQEDRVKLTKFITSVHAYALTGPIQYNCSVCSYTSELESRLKTHMMFLHSAKQRPPEFRKRLKKPIVQPSVEKWFQCDSCNFTTRFRENLKEHVRKHSTEKSLQCTICGALLRYKSGLRSHMKIHRETKPYACSECSYTAAQRSSLNYHILAKHTCKYGEKPFQCDKCSYSSSNPQYLGMHKLTHTGKKLYKCDKCHYLSTIENNLTSHSRKHLGNKRLGNKRLGIKHLGNKHLGNECFLCYLCGKSFTVKSSLEMHIRTHTGEKPYACRFCSFSTNNREYLKIHERIHTGEKPFACDRCGRLFTNKKHLQVHQLTHSGVRAFSCDKCDKSFALKGNLRAHMYTHTGERPFACDQCDYSTSHRTKLKYHRLSHSTEKPFSCE